MIYPEHDWKKQKFLREAVKEDFLKFSKDHQRALFDELAKKLNIKITPDDWYNVNRKIFIGQGK